MKALEKEEATKGQSIDEEGEADIDGEVGTTDDIVPDELSEIE